MKNIETKQLTKIFSIAIGFGLSLFTIPSVQAASYNFVPSTGTMLAECNQTIDIFINTTGQSSKAADIEILYNPSQVLINDSDSNTPGVQIGEGSAFEGYYGNDVTQGMGRIRMTGVSFISAVTSNQLFATINYTFIPGSGNTVNFDIRFDGVGVTVDSNIADSTTHTDILTSVTDAQFVFEDINCDTDQSGGDQQTTPTPVPTIFDIPTPTPNPNTTPVFPVPSATPGDTNGGGGGNGNQNPPSNSTPAIAPTPVIDLNYIKNRIDQILEDNIAPPGTSNNIPPGTIIETRKNQSIDQAITDCLNVIPLMDRITTSPTATQAVTYTIGVAALLQLFLPYLNILNTPSLILNVLNFLLGKGQKRPWGLIADSTTLQPIAFAVCKLYLGGTLTLIDQTVSDLEGKYGFPITPGNYRLEILKKGYEKFIKEINVGDKEKGYVYDINLFQENLRLKPTTANSTLRNIENHAIGLYHKVLPLLFVFGFLLSFVSAFRFGGILNWMILIIYFALIIINVLSKMSVKQGYSAIVDSKTMLRVPNALIKVYDITTGNLVDTKITNNNGYFEFWGDPGEYALDVSRRGYKFPSENNEYPLVKLDQKPMLIINLNKGENNLKLFIDPY